MPVTLPLTQPQRDELGRDVVGEGGHQSFLRELRSKVDAQTGGITLTDAQLGRVVRYAGYSQGGFQNRFKDIFGEQISAAVRR